MIIEIPKQAVVNRIVPKDRFNFDDATKIERIRWLGKLGPTTINLPAKKIQEIEIFSVDMIDFDLSVIKEIVSKIPQEILFIINDEILIMYYQGYCISKRVENLDLSQYLGHILVETAKTFSLFLNLQTPVELSNESNYGFDYDYKILQCS
ncbi:hypothetical protein ACQLO3_003400 [Listeria monocytogenes]